MAINCKVPYYHMILFSCEIRVFVKDHPIPHSPTNTSSIPDRPGLIGKADQEGVQEGRNVVFYLGGNKIKVEIGNKRGDT